MAISGHRTRSVFDRSDIVNLTGLERSVDQVQEYIARPGTRTVVTLQTVTDRRELSQTRHNELPAESSIPRKCSILKAFLVGRWRLELQAR